MNRFATAIGLAIYLLPFETNAQITIFHPEHYTPATLATIEEDIAQADSLEKKKLKEYLLLLLLENGQNYREPLDPMSISIISLRLNSVIRLICLNSQ